MGTCRHVEVERYNNARTCIGGILEFKVGEYLGTKCTTGHVGELHSRLLLFEEVRTAHHPKTESCDAMRHQ